MARLALVRSEGTGQSDCRLGDYNAFIKHSYTSWWRRGVTGSSGLQQSLTSAAAARRRTSIACLSHNVCAPCSVPALPVQTPTSALRNHRLGSGGCGAWQRHPSCRCGVCSCSLRSRGGHGHGVGQTVGRGAVVALHGSSQLTGCCCERSGALQAARSTGSRETSWQPGAFAHNIAAAAAPPPPPAPATGWQPHHSLPHLSSWSCAARGDVACQLRQHVHLGLRQPSVVCNLGKSADAGDLHPREWAAAAMLNRLLTALQVPYEQRSHGSGRHQAALCGLLRCVACCLGSALDPLPRGVARAPTRRTRANSAHARQLGNRAAAIALQPTWLARPPRSLSCGLLRMIMSPQPSAPTDASAVSPARVVRAGLSATSMSWPTVVRLPRPCSSRTQVH